VPRDDAGRLAGIVAQFPAMRERKPVWQAEIKLPGGEWTDLFRGRRLEAGVSLREWLRPLPVAALVSA